jgi:glutaconate CoA-transferase subunit B
MVVESLHPGVSEDTVRENTGWEVRFADSIAQTRPPSDLELGLLRNVIDPLGVLSRIKLN